MTDYLLCPDCGNDTFDQRRIVSVNVIVRIRDGGADFEDVDEAILERGERDESNIVCADCGSEFYPDTDELVTQEQYDVGEDE